MNIRLFRHVACMEDFRCGYKVFAGKSEEKRQNGCPSHRLEKYIA
jgi:hypothetical protein